MMPIIMARCLILTLLIEGLSALLIGVRNKSDFVNISLVNCMTNPLVVISTYLVGLFIGWNYKFPIEVVEEITVVIVEGALYYKTLNFRKINPFILSSILNAISYASGFVINAIVY